MRRNWGLSSSLPVRPGNAGFNRKQVSEMEKGLFAMSVDTSFCLFSVNSLCEKQVIDVCADSEGSVALYTAR